MATLDTTGRSTGPGTDRPEPAQQPAWAWPVAAIGLIAGLVPLLLTDFAPLHDWPSHLARIGILSEMLRGPSPWDRYYTLNGVLLPNEAVDFLLIGLMRLGFSLYGAAQAGLVLCYALFVGGYYRLATVCRAGGPLKAVFGAILFYNASLFFGFINYQLGLALLLWGVAEWLRAEAAGQPWRRVLLATLGTLVIFLCHLIAASMYTGIIGLIDCFAVIALARQRGLTPARILPNAISLLAVGVLLALFLASPTGGDGLAGHWTGTPTLLGIVRWKVGIFIKTLLGGAIESDLVLASGVVLLGIGLFATARVRLGWRMAFLMAATILVTLIAPSRLGTGSYFDYRIAILPILLGTAGLAVAPRRAASAGTLAALAAVVMVIRSATLSDFWLKDEAEFRQLDQVLAQLPPGGTLLGAVNQGAGQLTWRQFWYPPDANIASLGTRHGLFVPTVFAHPLQQPLAIRPAYGQWNVYADITEPDQLAPFLAPRRPALRGIHRRGPSPGPLSHPGGPPRHAPHRHELRPARNLSRQAPPLTPCLALKLQARPVSACSDSAPIRPIASTTTSSSGVTSIVSATCLSINRAAAPAPPHAA